jgi:endoglucanase
MNPPIGRNGLVFIFACVLASAPPSLMAAGEPVKMASSARFDLYSDSPGIALVGGHVAFGTATIRRMSWLPESVRSRGYTVSFPVSFTRWRPLAIQFTPDRAGTITLTLLGPWEEVSKGVPYRQEVFWDDVQAEGTALANGGFESPLAVSPAGWRSNGGIVVRQNSEVPAVEGLQYARTWHKAPLLTTLKVEGGRPVTIRLHARAVRPAGLTEMKRIASRSTPAHLAARRYLRGVNLSNGLEVPPGQDWGAHYRPEDLRLVRNEGFDHVRIPVAWQHYTGPGPEFRIRREIFAQVDELVVPALKNGLGVIINIHHFDDFTSHPKEETARFNAIWGQIAASYAGAGEELAFELLNEPKDGATTEVINSIFAETIAKIRRTNPKRTIVVGPGRWNSISELAGLCVPDDDHNLIVTVHNYEPFLFTHQGAGWAGPDTKVTGIRFPGPPREPLVPAPGLQINSWFRDWVTLYNNESSPNNPSGPSIFEGLLEEASDWSEYYGRPVYIGEFGCLDSVDPSSRLRYYQAFREAAEKAKIGWAMWGWKSNFHYWNAQTASPEPGMREALFGRSSSRQPK